MHVYLSTTGYPSYSSHEPQSWKTEDISVLDKTHPEGCYGLCASMRNGTTHKAYFKDATERDRAFNELTSSIAQPKTPPMKTVLTDIKAFIADNRNAIYLVAAILIIDHCFLGGRLTDRIKGIAEKLLGKVESKVDAIETKAVTAS